MTATEADRQALLETYRAAPARLAAALDGLSAAEIDARPAADDWTVREIVHHLADNEIIAGVRLRCILSQDNPTLVGYDEAGYAQRFGYADRPLANALALLTAAREANVDILRRLGEDDWARAGDHPESGHYTVYDLLEANTSHVANHIRQIEANRDALQSASA
jgi:DinB family protein